MPPAVSPGLLRLGHCRVVLRTVKAFETMTGDVGHQIPTFAVSDSGQSAGGTGEEEGTVRTPKEDGSVRWPHAVEDAGKEAGKRLCAPRAEDPSPVERDLQSTGSPWRCWPCRPAAPRTRVWPGDALR